MLLANGADVNAADVGGDTPLILAALHGDFHIVEVSTGTEIGLVASAVNPSVFLAFSMVSPL